MEWGLLSGLSAEDRDALLGLGRRRSFGRNEVVCHAGDPADSLHLVEAGHLSVAVSLPSGDTATVNVLGPGASFGELALLRDDRTRTATITAIQPARTIAISASVFQQLSRRKPEVDRTLNIMLGQRVDELSQRLLEMTYVGFDRRLYRRMVELAEGFTEPDGEVVIPLTQSQLADLAGGTRPTVNQVLQRLVEQGVVEVRRGRVVVLDLPALRRKCGA